MEHWGQIIPQTILVPKILEPMQVGVGNTTQFRLVAIIILQRLLLMMANYLPGDITTTVN